MSCYEDRIPSSEGMKLNEKNCAFGNSYSYKSNCNQAVGNSDACETEDNLDVGTSDYYKTKMNLTNRTIKNGVYMAKNNPSERNSNVHETERNANCNFSDVHKPHADVYNTRNDEATKTSDVYKTDNLPFRFEHPSKWNYDVANCVFNASQEVFNKYSSEGGDDFGSRKTHPLFRTTNSDYGSQPPCVHTMPLTYHPRRNKHWEHLARVGMYRNRGFNTAVDRSRV